MRVDGVGREGQGRTKEAGAVGGRGSPTQVPHSYGAACIRRAALRLCVLYCLLRAGLTKAEEVLSRERASVQAGLTVLSPSTQTALRRKFLETC